MVSGNLNMNTRSIINFKEPQPYQSTYAGNVNYVIKTNSDSNANLQINSKLKIYFFIFTVLVTTTKKSSNLITTLNTVSSSSSHFSEVNNELVVKKRGIYEIHLRDGCKRGAADVLLKRTA